MNKYPLLEAWEGNAALADLDPGILREVQSKPMLYCVT